MKEELITLWKEYKGWLNAEYKVAHAGDYDKDFESFMRWLTTYHF